MTTINMKDYVEENANKGNEAAREVMETISTIEPIVGNKNRTPEEKASDIGEIKGILKAAIASGKSKVIVSVPVKLLAIDTSYQIPERTERSLKKLIKNWDDEGNLKIKRGFKKSELAHLWIEKMHLKIDSFPMVFYEGEGENDD